MNDLQKKFLNNIVSPEIRKIRNSVLGFVTVVYEDERKVDVYYKDADGAVRVAKKVNFPKYGDGIFSEALESGDKVELSYKNQAQRDLYISSVIKRNQSFADFYLQKGTSLPLSVDLY